MSVAVKSLKATSIANAFQVAVDFIATDWVGSDLCWFRGLPDSQLPLIPGAYRRKHYDEYQSMVTFAQEGVAFQDIGTIDEWPTYYLAQHHGIPTRLLDWTESFSAALFFAFDGWKGRTTPCIWILQPCLLNETVLGWNGILAPENIPEMRLWLPRQIACPASLTRQDEDGFVYDNQWPLAIYPKKTNRRLHAQQGTFTVHGRQSLPLDKLIELRGNEPRMQLARLELRGFKKNKVLEELSLLGIRRSAIYPDIDNFVRELKQTYGW